MTQKTEIVAKGKIHYEIIYLAKDQNKWKKWINDYRQNSFDALIEPIKINVKNN